MFLEKLNVGDSLLFLSAAREALCNIIESSHMSLAETEKTKGFLMNEASDYEIMSLIMEGELPKVKYNDLDEALMFEELKSQMLQDAEVVGQFMDETMFASFVSEVDSVFPRYSSAKPIMEYQAKNRLSFNGEMISEVDAVQTATDIAAKGARLFDKMKNSGIVKALQADISKGTGGTNVDALIKKAIKTASSDMTKPIRDIYKSAVGNLKQSWVKSLQKTDPNLARMRAQKWFGGSGGKVEPGYLDKLKSQAALPDWRKQLNQRLTDVKNAADSAVDATKKALASAQQSIKAGGEEAVKYVKANPEQGYVAAAALASLAIFAGYKTYKRFMSQAAKACKGQTGDQKTACMKQYKKKALLAQAQDTQASAAACVKTKNPGKCKEAISRKVVRLKSKASKL